MIEQNSIFFQTGRTLAKSRHFLRQARSSAICKLLSDFILASAPEHKSRQPSSTRQGGVPGYVPSGYGWKPGSKISIQLWYEPCGNSCATTQWKHLFDVDVDQWGMFGLAGNAQFYQVHRNICGDPEMGQTVMFMAKNLNTGKIRMRQVGADLWFNHQPCR